MPANQAWRPASHGLHHDLDQNHHRGPIPKNLALKPDACNRPPRTRRNILLRVLSLAPFPLGLFYLLLA
jgi:hypothetical protein